MSEAANEAGQWLAAARAGPREALGRALESCRNYLLLVARQELDSDLQAKGGASDLVQETFLEAQRDFAQFHGATEGELLAWLRQVLLNNVANFTRRFRATGKRQVSREVPLAADDSSDEQGPALPADTSSPSGLAMRGEQALALQQALLRLPEDYRRVVVYRYEDGRSFEEIGRLLDRSPEAARKLWCRAMERLRQEYEGLP